MAIGVTFGGKPVFRALSVATRWPDSRLFVKKLIIINFFKTWPPYLSIYYAYVLCRFIPSIKWWNTRGLFRRWRLEW